LIYLLYTLLGILVTIVIGIIYRKYLAWPYRLVWMLAVLGCICEIAGYYIVKNLHAHNAWLFNLYMPLEPLLLGIAGTGFIKGNGYKKVIYALLAMNVMVWLFEIFKYSIFTFASLSMICGCFLLVAIYIGVLMNVAISGSKTLIKEPLFWLCLSTILYFGCDIPSMGLFHYWPTYKRTAIRLSNINQVLNFFRYPLVAVSFLLAVFQKKEEQKSSLSYVSR